MTPSAELRVLFRIAAGPRRGLGHLVRSLSVARAMGVRPLLCLRGPDQAADAALALGADLLTNAAPRSITLLRPDVVVVDDPVASAARPWVAAARRSGAIVVTIHDLGIGCPDGDVVFDGSLVRSARPKRGGQAFTSYAILDFALQKAQNRGRPGRGVLVALGGGPRRGTTMAIAKAIAAADPRAEIRIAGGFAAPKGVSRESVTRIGGRRVVADERSRATVAVVGGRVSLYEARAVGGPTVRAFARQGATPGVPVEAHGRRTAAEVVVPFDPHRSAQVRRRSRRLIDGKGATRAATAVLAFVQRKRL